MNNNMGSSVQGIDAIVYGIERHTDAFARAQKFFSDWGLSPVLVAEWEQVWETQSGAQVIVKPMDEPSLGPAIEPGPTLREIVWGVHAGSPLAGTATDDPHGLRLRFQVSRKKTLTVQGVPSNPWGRPQRIDTPSPVYDRATPMDIGHVVFFTDCLAQAVAFYESLGFVKSDQYPSRGVFMRCAPDGGHHNLFLLEAPGKAKGLNHVAFAVRDIHEVFGGGLHMSRCGWKTQLGPGRHPISSAYFWYFENPCGALIEYNADEDHLTAAWQPRDFTPGPTVFAEWAVDGGLDGHTRRQPKAQAGADFLTSKRS
jgi:catechol 2,3-dioxygenase-like lactoylglutathione lyase family enzyme